MAKKRIRFECEACGATASKWFGKCPACGEFNTAVETTSAPMPKPKQALRDLGVPIELSPPQPITAIAEEETQRLRTGIHEFDQVVGGGIVPGSMILLGGEPGIGKSTLMLQLGDALGRRGLKVMYASGEESPQQIKIRADRMEVESENLLVAARTSLEEIIAEPETRDASLLILDSLQSTMSVHLDSPAGSVGQLREVASRLTNFAKTTRIPVILIGHVTKEGSIAGPKLVEHVVDCVLYLEGEMFLSYRLLRTSKNRFGPTRELGIFEMVHGGLREVENPSSIFLVRREEDAIGAVVVPTMESSRPILAEVQALVTPTTLGNARRVATGIDNKKAVLLAAVLEKHLQIDLQSLDLFVNIAGGLRIAEPAVDLAVAVALLSSFHDRPLPKGTICLGEVSLTGEVRNVAHADARLAEAHKRGFTRAIVSADLFESLSERPSITCVTLSSIREVRHALFDTTHKGPAQGRASSQPEDR